MLTSHTTAPAPSRPDPYFAELRRRDFSRLDRTGHAYLDYAGTALYTERQLRAHYALLAETVFGNPHSESVASRASTNALEAARSRLLAHLDADPESYVVCFTANTSAAIKLVAESYPFAANGACALAADNHNSVNGVREYARRAGARVVCLPLDDELRLIDAEGHLARARRDTNRRALFAFPAQSNFSGVQHPLSLVPAAQALGYDVLVDAAAFLPSHLLSLRAVQPEFVTLSFYKIFGYPTGIGALVARRDALARLARPWFAGGTVQFASVQNDLHALRPDAEGFEDGTPHFLAASALDDGFALLDAVGMQRLSAHVRRLTMLLLAELRCLTYGNGTPAVRLHGPIDVHGRGGIVAFNLRDRSGAVVPYWLVEERARANGVSLRGGCFCNPGASEAAFRFDAGLASQCLRRASDGGFTVERFATCMSSMRPDTAVGAVRASLGMANNEADIQRAIMVLRSLMDQS